MGYIGLFFLSFSVKYIIARWEDSKKVGSGKNNVIHKSDVKRSSHNRIVERCNIIGHLRGPPKKIKYH